MAGRPAETGSGRASDTRQRILEAAETILRSEGYQALSTRHVALTSGVPLSQIHYHFGSKDGLLVATLDHLDLTTLDRQRRMFSREEPLSLRWRRACDFLEEDIASGYVRLLQGCIALGWSNAAVAERVRSRLDRWAQLLTGVAEEAERQFGPLGPFTPAQLAELVGKAFLGAESALLLGIDETRQPIREALYRIGDLIQDLEQRGGTP